MTVARKYSKRLWVLGFAGILSAAALFAQAQRQEVRAANGMAASAHLLASQAGVDILKMGGNAVDAAVAAAFAIGVAEPNACGIGGEGVMVIYLARNKKATAIDFRSAAPASVNFPEGFPRSGHASAAVPGTVAGLCLALEKYGTMDLAQALAPAIKIAEEGFVISPTLAGIILDHYELLMEESDLAELYCPGELPLEAGAVLRNPDLAQTLRRIAAEGPQAFYRGKIAEQIAAEMQARGGFITADDLAGYRAIEREPVRGKYRGHLIISAPPPAGGLAVIEILNILGNFSLDKMKPLSRGRVHLLAEAMKRGLVDWRAFVGDPDFVRVPVSALLSQSYSRFRAAEIEPGRISNRIEAGVPGGLQSASTTSLATADKEGNLVALTQTLSDFFGGKVIVDGTGILLNNEMKNFSAAGPNALAPGKRMRTAVAPTLIVKRGRALAALGTPGGIRILTTTALVLSNLIDHGMGIQEAIEMPRFFPLARELTIEPRFPEKTVGELEMMGYEVKPLREFDLFFGGAQGIVIDPKTRMKIGGADPRRDGAVVGY